MRNKALIAAFVGCINLNVYGSDVFNKHLRGEAKEEVVDCDDPKNTPRYVGGYRIGGKMECDVNRGSNERVKRSFNGTIGRNPVTGKVTSKAELLGGNKATNNLEKAQMNYGKRDLNLKRQKKPMLITQVSKTLTA